LSFLGIIYSVTAVFLAVYGFNSFLLTLLYLRHRREKLPRPPLVDTPPVTVQLPIYNELYVVERLLEAVARLDYPGDKLQIQVLDDSDDETTALALARVAHYRAQGLDIELIRRAGRSGFKAGALAHGLRTARGEYIAVFDADFVPPPDFLAQTVPYFRERPRLGLIQTRWGHLNADYSPLTQAQALALDGHFVVEQTARYRAGLYMNFNGTAGVWRRRCIEEAGGWAGDTLSEDLDLSYRAQLAGWQCLYLPEAVAPAELPPQMAAFKRQQFRWAKGSIQVLRKLGWKVARAPVSPFKRLEGLLHLSSYLVHPLMLILLLVTLPLMFERGGIKLPLAYLSLVSLGPPFLFAASQRALYRDWQRRFAYLPLLVFLGTGIALSNTRAVVEALLGQGNDFRRTPKFDVRRRGDNWMSHSYALPFRWLTLGELLLSFYALCAVLVALRHGNVYAVPFLLIYVLGFAYVAGLDLWQTRASWPPLLASLWRPHADSNLQVTNK
jgi:cellulose synthase/poly-beta-1,6-N-acetylglucosamine synthase-like glycosyltransferase